MNKKKNEEKDTKILDELLKSSLHTSFESFSEYEDEDLKEAIEETYGYFNQRQYEFSRRFATKLNELNLTNAKFAKNTNISEGAISNYRTGKRIPRTAELEKIAEVLNVTPNYLLGLTDCVSFTAEQINQMLGLSEKAMKILFMLQHDVTEVEEITDNIPVAEIHKNKLRIFSFLIEDNSKFCSLLTYLEQYAKVKNKIKKYGDCDGILQYELVGLQGRIMTNMQDFLEKL